MINIEYKSLIHLCTDIENNVNCDMANNRDMIQINSLLPELYEQKASIAHSVFPI